MYTTRVRVYITINLGGVRAHLVQSALLNWGKRITRKWEAYHDGTTPTNR